MNKCAGSISAAEHYLHLNAGFSALSDEKFGGTHYHKKRPARISVALE